MLARYDADKHFIAPTPAWRVGVAFLALIAFSAAGALGLLQFTVRFLDRGYGMVEHLGLRPIAESPWSTWLGIPVGLLGSVVYGAIIIALCYVGPGTRSRRQGHAWRLLVVLALTVIGAAIWFAFVQFKFLEQLCPLCILGQCAGAGAGVAILLHGPIRLRKRRRPQYDPIKLRRHHMAWLSGTALMLVGILAAGQLLTGWLEHTRDDTLMTAQVPTALRKPTHTRPASEDPADIPPEKLAAPDAYQENLSVAQKLWQPSEAAAATEPASGAQAPPFRFRGSVYLDRREYPILGRLDAPALALWLLDYRDPSSRIMFGQMEEVRHRFGSQLAIMVIPVDAPAEAMHSLDYVPPTQPIDPKDDLTALALTVFKAKPESFELFHRYLLGGDKAPTLEAARRFAGSLIGEERLRLMRNDIDIQDQMQRHIRIFKTSDFATVPQLRAPGIGAAVTPQDPDALQHIQNFLEKNLHLRALDGSTHASAQRPAEPVP